VSLLDELNPRARSLHGFYGADKTRLESYEAMVEAILAPVRAGRTVCAAFYGHPGVFVYPAHEAVERAREEGARAWMLPGISSIDCLFADLGIDPARTGCQLYHASDFLLYRSRPDTAATLVLLQIAVIGALGHLRQPDLSRLPVLIDYLGCFYPIDHEVIPYEASPFPVLEATVERVPLSRLAEAELTIGTTLVVPPASSREVDPTMADRLGLSAC
jgi:hypothetical protein